MKHTNSNNSIQTIFTLSKTNRTMKFTSMLFAISMTLMVSCNKNNTSNNTTNNTSNNTNNAITKNVTFKVNDTLCRTIASSGGDMDEHLGIFTENTAQLDFDLWGDVPTGRPHRGNLHFSIKNFQFQPGTYLLSASKDNYASFTRYETINAGGAKDYMAENNDWYTGTSFTFNVSSIVKDPESLNSRDYLATGTFSVVTQNKVFTQAERNNGTKTITITEGAFTKVRIAGGPK